MPYFAQGPAGEVLLSWIDPLGDAAKPAGHALRWSRYTGSGWSAPETVATGNNWFVNWADFPALNALPDGTLLAHWLDRSGQGGRYGYGIRVARRDAKQGTWREVHAVNLAASTDYAGFLSFVPGEAMAVFLAPPPAAQQHNQSGDPADHGSHEEHRKTVRFVDLKNAKPVEVEMDADACTCCPTTVVRTPRGLVAAFRDHLPGEIRDISVTRYSNGKWSTPKPVANDGWEINGCPTDGPSLAADGKHVALAWLTRAKGQARVQIALSQDSAVTFSTPLQVDAGNPLGRPAVVRLNAEAWLVTWLEKAASGSLLQARRIGRNGVPGPVATIAKVPGARASGMPKVAVAQGQVLFAWRDERVKVVAANAAEFTQ